MTFTITYHPDVVSEDIPALPLKEKGMIQEAIQNKLVRAPEAFGKPLRKSLKNYRRLRVGDYRVVFRLSGSQVRILLIAHRSIVYSPSVISRLFSGL
ncbi:MAG: type II toxin-antitoxin system RelE/ParE family toxin [Candidatus Peribacteraceae bacterium]|nr:type II toxin-antitoxin system RelE/ParE family toxin [Candidatus Peribacteraceae bacterium]